MSVPVTSKVDLSALSVTPIESKNCLRGFECRVRQIDRWAADTAFKLHATGRARVSLARFPAKPVPVGFYSISLNHQQNCKLDKDQRDKWKDGAPLIFVDWIATHHTLQGQGLGTHMLMDALRKAWVVFETLPIYGVALRSLNGRTTKLYDRLGFRQAPDEGSSPLMILPIWTIRDLFTATDMQKPENEHS